jgi:hypothetical protein
MTTLEQVEKLGDGKYKYEEPRPPDAATATCWKPLSAWRAGKDTRAAGGGYYSSEKASDAGAAPGKETYSEKQYYSGGKEKPSWTC